MYILHCMIDNLVNYFESDHFKERSVTLVWKSFLLPSLILFLLCITLCNNIV